MKDLYIVGAGGFGRELLGTVLDFNEIVGPTWNVKGFLDDTPHPLAGKECDYGVCGTIRDYIPQTNDGLLMGIANPPDKRKLARLLKEKNVIFDTCIHPYASKGRHNHIGEGGIIGYGSSLTVNIVLGNFVTLLSGSLGHDVHVGAYSTISGFCNIMGGVTIGEGVFLGGSVVVAPKVTIGDGAYVCAGSVVLEDVPAGAKVLGNPAREIG